MEDFCKLNYFTYMLMEIILPNLSLISMILVFLLECSPVLTMTLSPSNKSLSNGSNFNILLLKCSTLLNYTNNKFWKFSWKFLLFYNLDNIQVLTVLVYPLLMSDPQRFHLVFSNTETQTSVENQSFLDLDPSLKLFHLTEEENARY